MTFDTRERIAIPDPGAIEGLRFLTTVDFPPFNFIDQTGKLSGFHIDLAREICRTLAIEPKCRIQAVAFDDLQPALARGEGDAVIAGMAATPALRRTFAFSRGFMTLPARFAANRRIAASAASIQDLKGKTIGVTAGSVHEAMARAFFPDLPLKSFTDRQAMLSGLRTGEVAAVFSDGVQLSFWTQGTDSAGCCRLLDGAYSSPHFLGEGLTVMTRQEPALTQAIDHALLELSRNGRLNEIYLRYFPTGIF